MPRVNRSAAAGLVASWLSDLSGGRLTTRPVTLPRGDIKVTGNTSGREFLLCKQGELPLAVKPMRYSRKSWLEGSRCQRTRTDIPVQLLGRWPPAVATAGIHISPPRFLVSPTASRARLPLTPRSRLPKVPLGPGVQRQREPWEACPPSLYTRPQHLQAVREAVVCSQAEYSAC